MRIAALVLGIVGVVTSLVSIVLALYTRRASPADRSAHDR